LNSKVPSGLSTKPTLELEAGANLLKLIVILNEVKNPVGQYQNPRRHLTGLFTMQA
jgi:hypothetical protein